VIKIVSFAGIALVVLIAGVLVVVATRPDTFRVQRSTDIKAPPERIFALINDFDRWSAWSPYEKKDPAMKRTRGGAAAGKGAVYAWEGNKDVGMGRMEIADAAPPTKITIKLDFTKPFEAHNIVEFTMVPAGDATRVTWAMHGPQPYIGKLVGLFLNMDRMVGRDFEAGLANLKTAAET
jgi:uncharacterized protein YndB with AHSA1/START domain